MNAYERIAATAASNHNLLTLTMIEQIPTDDDETTSARRLDSLLRRKVVQRLYPGVFLFGAAPPTWEQRVRAAVLAIGPPVAVSHRSLAVINEIDGASTDLVELTVPMNREIDLRGVTVYRSRRGMGKVRQIDGLPLGSIERMLLDYAAVTKNRLLVERAVEDVLNRGLTTEERVWRELIEHGGRGVAGSRLLREVLLKRPRGRPAKKLLEIFLGHVLDAAGIPGIRNHRVQVDGENWEIDRAYPDGMVALEADSKKFHSTATAVGEDAARQAKLEAAGWFFVRTDWTEVIRHPARLVARVRAALAERRAA